MSIADAPWIRETERTGHSRYGYWNSPPQEGEIVCQKCREDIPIGCFYYDIDGEILCEECFDDVTREWRRLYEG